MFEAETAGQMAAWFLNRESGKMPHLKLTKLLYLAERASFERYGIAILGDDLFSLPYGPVLSRTLNYMRGKMEPGNDWDKWISPPKENHVSLARKYEANDLDMLSDATLEILEEVWEEFGGMNQWQIKDYTHRFPEWEDPGNSRLPIAHEKLLRVLGYDEEKVAELVLELRAQRNICKSLSEKV